ncbi:MAG: RsmD family RNA methyltransferase [Actinomycetaceae bacterium]|nr:RsmD family RNA methyltransferase [Actinomycetaceae bacterium]
MARIVAGSAKGRILKVPATHTRPTSERVREALFSRLEHMGYVEGCAILDLYAGSGAFALEALSRGAAYAECVDSQKQAARIIEQNARTCGVQVAVTCAKVAKRLAGPPTRLFDVVFLDPPYDMPDEEVADALRTLPPHMAEDGIVLVERSKRSPEPEWGEDFVLLDERTWGDTRVWFAECTTTNGGAESLLSRPE